MQRSIARARTIESAIALARSRILIVDDELDAAEALRQVLLSGGYDAVSETSAQRALARVANECFDLVLTDLSMKEMSGFQLSLKLSELRPDLPVVIVTGRGDMNTVVAALRLGARDFLLKPVDSRALLSCVSCALHDRGPQNLHLRPEADVLRVVPEFDISGVLGESPAIQRVYALIKDLSHSLASVLIEGETGVGKEVIARAIHSNSALSAGPFVAVDCASIPAELLESELFGHVRGAFTDAGAVRTGLLVQANGGTLLLDEVGELPLAMQPKLLRALQERLVRPVGGNKEIPFNCRVITATNRNLEQEVAERRFRQDLYYRINVVSITVPPLRERGEDILALAKHFLARFAGKKQMTLSAETAERLLAYAWPGNVRELENCIERCVALASAAELSEADLPEKIRLFVVGSGGSQRERGYGASFSPDAGSPIVALSEIERSHILKTIEALDGNKTLTADLLGIDRRTLHRRLEQYRMGAASTDADLRL